MDSQEFLWKHNYKMNDMGVSKSESEIPLETRTIHKKVKTNV